MPHIRQRGEERRECGRTRPRRWVVEHLLADERRFIDLACSPLFVGEGHAMVES